MGGPADRRWPRQARAFYARLRVELIAYAEREWQLSAPVGDGSNRTVREDLASIAFKNAEARAQLAMPPLSRYGVTVWSAFGKLSRTRTSNGFGPNPLLPSEVGKWLELYRMKFPRPVIDLFFELDGLSRKAHAARIEGLGAPGGGPRRGLDE